MRSRWPPTRVWSHLSNKPWRCHSRTAFPLWCFEATIRTSVHTNQTHWLFSKVAFQKNVWSQCICPQQQGLNAAVCSMLYVPEDLQNVILPEGKKGVGCFCGVSVMTPLRGMYRWSEGDTRSDSSLPTSSHNFCGNPVLTMEVVTNVQLYWSKPIGKRLEVTFRCLLPASQSEWAGYSICCVQTWCFKTLPCLFLTVQQIWQTTQKEWTGADTVSIPFSNVYTVYFVYSMHNMYCMS